MPTLTKRERDKIVARERFIEAAFAITRRLGVPRG